MRYRYFPTSPCLVQFSIYRLGKLPPWSQSERNNCLGMETRLIYYYVTANFVYFMLKLSVLLELHHPFLHISFSMF